MPAAPVPPVTAPRVLPLSGTWTIEQRRFLGLVGGALCLGIIVGSKLARGPAPPPEQVFVAAPCAECAEREIQRQRAAARGATAPVVRPLPGDVPPAPTMAPQGQGAASLDISGAIVDNSKGHVTDPSFIAGGYDASSVPGQ